MARRTVSRFLLGNVTLTVLTADLSGFYMHNCPQGPPLLRACWWGWRNMRMDKGSSRYILHRERYPLCLGRAFIIIYCALRAQPTRTPFLWYRAISKILKQTTICIFCTKKKGYKLCEDKGRFLTARSVSRVRSAKSQKQLVSHQHTYENGKTWLSEEFEWSESVWSRLHWLYSDPSASPERIRMRWRRSANRTQH